MLQQMEHPVEKLPFIALWKIHLVTLWEELFRHHGFVEEAAAEEDIGVQDAQLEHEAAALHRHVAG